MKLNELAQETLEDACQALLPPAPKTASEADPALCRAAVIGFAGDKVQGTLGIATSQTGLGRILDHAGVADDVAAQGRSRAEDSLAELSNLILGHVKRAWLRRGVHITLATPLVIRGLAIEVCGGEGNSWFSSESSAGGDRITTWVDLHTDDDLDIPSADVETDLIAEGETLLF